MLGGRRLVLMTLMRAVLEKYYRNLITENKFSIYVRGRGRRPLGLITMYLTVALTRSS